jgi:GGDEF domain-containing protein
VAQSSGDTVPVADWPVPHRYPVLPIMVPAREPRTYLLRIENPHTFSAPLALVSESGFAREEQRAALTLGMYFGLALLAFMVGVLGAAWLRDSAFGWYAVAVGTMALTQASLSGVAGLHLWPRFARWNDLAPFVLPVLACGALVRFFASVLGVRLLSPPLFRWVTAVLAASLAVAGLLGIAEPAWRVRLLVGYTSLCAATSVAIFAWASRRRDRFAGLMIWANVPVLVGSAFPLARIAGLIPTSFLTSYGMQLGLAIELPILLLVLMLRSQSRRENIRRLQALDRIDPASGLINGAVFHERLVRLIARSQRLKFRASVLVIDIVNMERIARDFDRRAVQELPLRVAGRLLSATRDVDSVARLGEHRFGMLLEGPLRADEVAAAAPRVVAQCLMPFKNKPLHWVAEVRVAQALVPQDGTDAELLVQQLEAVLAAVPADSKRAVFMLGLGDGIAVAS